MRILSLLSLLLAAAFLLALAAVAGQPGAPVADWVTETPVEKPTETYTPTPSQTPTATPTLGTQFAHLPEVLLAPTFTPTLTPTRTPTPTATRTGMPGASGLTGQIVLKLNKPSYATYIENVYFYQLLHNPTGGPIAYSYLGVNVRQPDGSYLPFKTSWTGAPDTILPGCYGPNGAPCSPGPDGAWNEDHVGDDAESTAWEIRQPGGHVIELWVCYSSHAGCGQPGAAWAKLAEVGFTAVHWTPSAPGIKAEEPDWSDRACFLIVEDPEGPYLRCPPGVDPSSQH